MIVEFKHKGTYSELIACAWLLDQGYDVFRNVSQHGLIDIVAIRGEEVLKLDVKTKQNSKKVRGYRDLKPAQVEAGVKALLVSPDKTCEICENSGNAPTWLGQNNPSAKLSTDEVLEIFNSKEKRVVLARKYKVNRKTIQRIQTGEQWSSITKNLKFEIGSSE